MTRDESFDNLRPLHSLYYIVTLKNISRSWCALQCSMHQYLCRAILYNEDLFSCYLLNCYQNERLVDRGRIDGGWEFWIQNDACPTGWVPFQYHCYFLNKTTVPWSQAKVQCEYHGAYLLEIDSGEENTWAMETFLPLWNAADCSNWWDCCECWIGATDIEIEGMFTWTSHVNISFSNWYARQPDNLNMAHCVRICRNGFWDDTSCHRNNTFICEMVYF
ncbi:perlucin-like protein [Saccostrea cucullata]|uniref:perlucin-like protein n=1 Tax=Saccostrea cuccullata TaxID=36930 RepID=UPI002ED2C4E4